MVPEGRFIAAMADADTTPGGNIDFTGDVQDKIPFDGKWTVEFYTDKQAERQSLSKALRPQADN